MQVPSGLQLSSPLTREWLNQRKERLKPWLTFFSTSHFGPPQTPVQWQRRIVKNLDYFQSNYMFVSVGLILYCLITSPLLLIVLAASFGASYIISVKNAETPIVVAGHVIPLAYQYAAVGLLTIPFYFLAGASAVIFWVIGASFVLIMAHASLYNVEAILGDDEKPFDLNIEEFG